MFIIVKLGDEYVVREGTVNLGGFKTEKEAEDAAVFLNKEVFQQITALGKGSTKLGTEAREAHNATVTRQYKLKK